MTLQVRWALPAAALLLLSGCSPAKGVRQELAPLSDALGRLEQRVAALERLQPAQPQKGTRQEPEGFGERIMEKSRELLDRILPGD